MNNNEQFDPTGGQPMPDVAPSGRQPKPVLPRPVTGRVAPGLAEFVKPELMPDPSVQRRTSNLMQQSGMLYTGEALMDSKGNITRLPYDPVRETLPELSRLDTAERLALLNELYQRGLYPRGSKPSSTGTAAPDLQAMGELLQSANAYGYEWSTAITLLRADFPSTMSGRGGRRGTPVEDIRKSVDQQALAALGRKFTDEEVAGLVAQIQGREAGGDRTSLSTMAEGAVSGAAQDEQTAYRFAQVADLFNDMLRSGR